MIYIVKATYKWMVFHPPLSVIYQHMSALCVLPCRRVSATLGILRIKSGIYVACNVVCRRPFHCVLSLFRHISTSFKQRFVPIEILTTYIVTRSSLYSTTIVENRALSDVFALGSAEVFNLMILMMEIWHNVNSPMFSYVFVGTIAM